MSARDTLNNPSARLNCLCVELQATDLFRPSLDWSGATALALDNVLSSEAPNG